MFEEDNPAAGMGRARARVFVVAQVGIVQLKPAVLTAPLGRCRSAAFVCGTDHVLESSDLFSTCRYPDALVSRGKNEGHTGPVFYQEAGRF